MGTADVSVPTPGVLQKAPVPTIDVAGEGGPTTNGEHADASDNEDEEGGDPWETDSDMSDNDKRVAMDKFDFQYASASNPDVCTKEEAKDLRERLHKVGANQFIFDTLSSGTYSVRKICTAFGMDLPAYLREDGEDHYYGLLGQLIERELAHRRSLPQYTTIDHAAKLLKEKKNIIVITGAGISTSLGIPDFRSKNTGFYEKLKERGIAEPEEVFELARFDANPDEFFDLAADILPPTKKTTPTHAFIALLQKEQKLLTNYTQNIDNIEHWAEIEKERLVQCHGSWATATCRVCKHHVDGTDIFEDVQAHRVAHCKMCKERLAATVPTMKRKRAPNGHAKARKKHTDSDSEDDGRYDIPQPGVMKPDITFFGEALPDRFFKRIQKDRPEISSDTGRIQFLPPDEQREKRRDLTKAPFGPVDLVIVIGTSMKVAPVSEIPHYIPHSIPHIYISRDPIRHINFDINLIGDCDPIVAELCRRAGYDLQHEMLNKNQEMHVQALSGDLDNTWTVQPVKTEPIVPKLEPLD